MYSENNLSHRHSVRHKTHKDWPDREHKHPLFGGGANALNDQRGGGLIL